MRNYIGNICVGNALTVTCSSVLIGEVFAIKEAISLAETFFPAAVHIETDSAKAATALKLSNS